MITSYESSEIQCGSLYCYVDVKLSMHVLYHSRAR